MGGGASFGAVLSTLRLLLSHRDFRWLWLGQSLSEAGDRMIAIVVALYVVKLTVPRATSE